MGPMEVRFRCCHETSSSNFRSCARAAELTRANSALGDIQNRCNFRGRSNFDETKNQELAQFRRQLCDRFLDAIAKFFANQPRCGIVVVKQLVHECICRWIDHFGKFGFSPNRPLLRHDVTAMQVNKTIDRDLFQPGVKGDGTRAKIVGKHSMGLNQCLPGRRLTDQFVMPDARQSSAPRPSAAVDFPESGQINEVSADECPVAASRSSSSVSGRLGNVTLPVVYD